MARARTAQGYKGSSRTVYRFLTQLKEGSAAIGEGSQAVSVSADLQWTAKQAVWWFLRDPSDLKEQEQQALATLRAASPTADTAYALAQEFMQMLNHREGQRLDAWLSQVRASHIPELQRFVRSIQRDKDAILAGLTLMESNGPVEGQVNRLKLIKRSMYGRAEIDLLKLRVLHHSKKNQERKNKKKQAQQEDPLKILRGRRKNTNSQHTITGISKVA